MQVNVSQINKFAFHVTLTAVYRNFRDSRQPSVRKNKQAGKTSREVLPAIQISHFFQQPGDLFTPLRPAEQVIWINPI